MSPFPESVNLAARASLSDSAVIFGDRSSNTWLNPTGRFARRGLTVLH